MAREDSVEHLSQLLLLRWGETRGEDDVPTDDQVALLLRRAGLGHRHALACYSRLEAGLDNLTLGKGHGDAPAVECLNLFADGTSALGTQQRLRQSDVELDDEVVVDALEPRVRLLLYDKRDGSERSAVILSIEQRLTEPDHTRLRSQRQRTLSWYPASSAGAKTRAQRPVSSTLAS